MQMKKICLLLIFGFVCINSFAQQNSFLGATREHIKEDISKSNNMHISNSAVANNGQRFDIVEYKSSSHITCLYYNDNNICVADKEVWGLKNQKIVVDDLNERFTKIDDTHWINHEKTMRVETGIDQGRFTETFIRL
jgi:hypothetical protein